MTKVKWTKPREELMREVANGPTHFAPNWPPAKWALENGFVTVVDGRYGNDRYTITDAGRKALEAHP